MELSMVKPGQSQHTESLVTLNASPLYILTCAVSPPFPSTLSTRETLYSRLPWLKLHCLCETSPNWYLPPLKPENSLCVLCDDLVACTSPHGTSVSCLHELNHLPCPRDQASRVWELCRLTSSQRSLSPASMGETHGVS